MLYYNKITVIGRNKNTTRRLITHKNNYANEIYSKLRKRNRNTKYWILEERKSFLRLAAEFIGCCAVCAAMFFGFIWLALI